MHVMDLPRSAQWFLQNLTEEESSLNRAGNEVRVVLLELRRDPPRFLLCRIIFPFRAVAFWIPKTNREAGSSGFVGLHTLIAAYFPH